MLNKKAVIDILKSSKRILQDKYGVIAMYLYGSFSIDQTSDTSDVDVLVEVPRPYKKLRNYLEMKNLLQTRLHRPVDLVYWDSLNPLIKEEIRDSRIKIE